MAELIDPEATVAVKAAVKTPIARIALIGNPNSGKSSLFNQLTGLNQKVGNFPGVTVDKKTGICHINSTSSVQIIDLPGTYSLYPKSLDERVVMDIMANPKEIGRASCRERV